ncbi:MAG TPA: ammonium transporter [Terriglobia bacterium]|nr:ammonium transporter [Terriglobia bacterium]
MPTPAPALSETAAALSIVLILLVPLAGAGLSLINAGLGRSRSAAHAMMASLCIMAVAAIAYFVCGFAWQGFIGGPAHTFAVAGKEWNWIAAERLFLRGLDFDGSRASLAAWLGMLSVGLAALIPLGSGADRWRLGATCASTAILAGLTYPLFAHWVWGNGWLASLGANYGLGRGFVDAGGSSSIQAVGGLTALSVAWILGPRRGKYTHEGIPTAIPGHNSVLVMFACLLALMGWMGLNSAGAILFTGAEPGRVALIAINTTLAATSAALASALITRQRFGKPDASLTANGWVGGLAASSAACALVTPAAAVIIGLVAGTLVTLGVELIESRLGIDDPGGAVSVHGVCGIWGVMAVGVFAHFPGALNAVAATSNEDSRQWLAQLVGVATLLGFVLPMSYGLNWLLNRFYPQRVAVEGERQGMDLYELGAGAYPEFLTHTDEFTQR